MGKSSELENKCYRIVWWAIFTGETGHGTGVFTLEKARLIADQLNESDSGKLVHHSVEEVPEWEKQSA